MILRFVLCTPASAADATAVNVNPDGSKTLLANGFSLFFIRVKSVSSNDPTSLLGSPPDYTIVDSWVLNNFILFAKTVRSLKTLYQLIIIYVEN